MLAAGTIAPPRRAIAELLAEARSRTLLLVNPLSTEDLGRSPEPGLGSVLSELTRIVHYEEQLLLGGSTSAPVTSYDQWFDAMTEVRQQVLQRLDEVDAADHTPVWQRHRMAVEHEYQRGEVILEILQALGEPYQRPEQRSLPRGRRLADPGIMARFSGGIVEIGASEHQSVWADERTPHRVSLRPFWIDLMPVTNGDFMTFMGEGGYSERDVWSEEGWRWVKASRAQMPRHWSWQDGAWWTRSLGQDAPVDFTCPVSQVSYHEAEAFARFVGKRLPTEYEWEAAASWDPESQRRRLYPWGNMAPSPHVANLDQLAFSPAPVGAFPGNMSAIGCYGMIGDVWEWTASDFLPYPGATEHPAAAKRRGTETKVLRGGSWATRPGAIRASTRRPASPDTRHIFSGFRCARDG
jgi:gamma-glutamyl hercynylcysteine S-oxide synthase